MILNRLLAAAIATGLLAACGDVTPAAAPAGSGAPTTGEALPTEAPGAPLTLDYRILGNPVAGLPVAVELTIDAALEDRPILLNYQAAEAGSLEFPESQAESVTVTPASGGELRPVQVTLVPGRDGRIFLSVQATIETDTGSVRKAMSIPILVSPAPLNEEERGPA